MRSSFIGKSFDRYFGLSGRQRNGPGGRVAGLVAGKILGDSRPASVHCVHMIHFVITQVTHAQMVGAVHRQTRHVQSATGLVEERETRVRTTKASIAAGMTSR